MSRRAGLRGDLTTLKGLRAKLRAAPVHVAHAVAQQGAPVVTSLTQGAFASGRTVYGDPRPSGVRGPLTLERTGRAKGTLRFVSNGTQIRCVIGEDYVRYLIGKYGVLPNGNAALPEAWTRELARIVAAQRVPP